MTISSLILILKMNCPNKSVAGSYDIFFLNNNNYQTTIIIVPLVSLFELAPTILKY